MPRATAADDHAARVRHLILLDAQSLMHRLDDRTGTMLSVFSRLRDREVLTTALGAWFDTARFEDLICLSPAQQSAVAAFYGELDDLRWYLRYTTDMPGSMEQALTRFRRGIVAAYDRLVDVLATPPPPIDPPPRRPTPRKRRPA